MKALENIWFIGADFLKEILNGLHAIKAKAIASKQCMLYIFQYFNMKDFYAKFQVRGLNKLINPIIDALNEEEPQHLLKVIVMVPDKDILESLVNTTAFTIGAAIYYLLKQINITVECRKQDLLDKRPGALNPNNPTFIWVRMLRCPHNIISEKSKALFALRGKFNSILEERLAEDGSGMHHLISIEINDENFDFTGCITSAGKSIFWRELDRGLSKFDKGEITLKPRKPHTAMPQQIVRSFIQSVVHWANHPNVRDNGMRKLPTPPMRRSRSSSRGRHCHATNHSPEPRRRSSNSCRGYRDDH